jgi:hypothetical protein
MRRANKWLPSCERYYKVVIVFDRVLDEILDNVIAIKTLPKLQLFTEDVFICYIYERILIRSNKKSGRKQRAAHIVCRRRLLGNKLRENRAVPFTCTCHYNYIYDGSDSR